MSLPSTMQEQIKEIERIDISYRKLHPSIIIKDEFSERNIEIPFSSLTNKYRDYLKKCIINVELPDAVKLRYYCKPKTVSYDFYKTTELWNDILILNNCFSIKDFHPEVLKIYDPKRLKEYLNEIMIIEKVFRKRHR